MAELSSYPAVTTLAGTERIPVITTPGVGGGNKYITAANLYDDLAADTAFTARYASGHAKTIHVSPLGSDANDGLVDSHAKLTLQAAITALGGAGKIKLAPGTYNSATMITVSGHTYDYINIEGSGMGATTLVLTADAANILKFVNVSQFTLRDFSVVCAVGVTTTCGLLITATGSSEVGLIENVRSASSGSMAIGFGVGTDTTLDVAEMTFVACQAQICTTAGWQVGNGSAANVLDIRAFGCISSSNGIGVYFNGGGMSWSHGSTLGNSVADFKCSAPASYPILIEGVRSEASRTFWEFTGGQTSGTSTVSLIGNTVANFTEASGIVVNHISRLNLVVIGGSYYGGVADTQMIVGESATACEFVAQGVVVGRTATTTPFVAYGVGYARMTISGCSRMNPATGATTPAVDWNTVVVRSLELAISTDTALTIDQRHAITASSARAISLPTPVGFAGRTIDLRIVTSSTALVTLSTAAGNIDGAATRIMWAGESASLVSDGTNWVKVSGKSIPMIARLGQAGAQSINASSFVKLLFDAANLDNTGLMADLGNNQVTIKRPGNYDVVGRVGWGSFASAAARLITIVYKNGATVIIQEERQVLSGGTPTIMAPRGGLTLAAADTISVSTYQTSAGAQSINPGIAAANAPGLDVVEVVTW